jgi:type I site-specific restriction endonuclease
LLQFIEHGRLIGPEQEAPPPVFLVKSQLATQIMTEADTCRELVTPKLTTAGWGNAPHVIGEQRTFTNGRIIVTGGRVRRGKQKRADYLLYYRN